MVTVIYPNGHKVEVTDEGSYYVVNSGYISIYDKEEELLATVINMPGLMVTSGVMGGNKKVNNNGGGTVIDADE